MNRKERGVIAAVLMFITLLVAFDIFTDAKQGVILWHIMVEASVGVLALSGVFYILRGSLALRHQLEEEKIKYSDLEKDAQIWRKESKKFIEGLASAIDHQLSLWNLTLAEKEVAFLLLKGLSLKEIAQVRNTTEKTAKVQSTAIYSKSGLSGRSELSAFFLEDLLVPREESSDLVSS